MQKEKEVTEWFAEICTRRCDGECLITRGCTNAWHLLYPGQGCMPAAKQDAPKAIVAKAGAR